MQRNSRAWHGPVEHNNDAPVNRDGHASEGASEMHDDETFSGQLAAGNGIQIAIVRPRNFRDAAAIGEYYRAEIPVIINLEDMSNADAWRIIDFASGLILGRRGDIERISRRTFLIMPAAATILTPHNGLTEEGFFNQALRSVNDSRVSGAGRPPGPGGSIRPGRRGPAGPVRDPLMLPVRLIRCCGSRRAVQRRSRLTESVSRRFPSALDRSAKYDDH